MTEEQQQNPTTTTTTTTTRADEETAAASKTQILSKFLFAGGKLCLQDRVSSPGTTTTCCTKLD